MRSLYRLRGRARPVVVAGQLPFVQDAIAAARPYSEGLRGKGVGDLNVQRNSLATLTLPAPVLFTMLECYLCVAFDRL